MDEDIKKICDNICENYGVDPNAKTTGVTRPETPYQRLKRQQEEQSPENMLKGSIWDFHYTEQAGSDPVVMQMITEAWEKSLPFGLKCQRSRIVFIPHKLKAHWIWSDDSRGPSFHYKDRQDMLTGIRFQYIGHKEFITTAELAALAKIILYTKALENVESWERKILSQPGQPPRPLEPGEGGI